MYEKKQSVRLPRLALRRGAHQTFCRALAWRSTVDDIPPVRLHWFFSDASARRVANAELEICLAFHDLSVIWIVQRKSLADAGKVPATPPNGFSSMTITFSGSHAKSMMQFRRDARSMRTLVRSQTSPGCRPKSSCRGSNSGKQWMEILAKARSLPPQTMPRNSLWGEMRGSHARAQRHVRQLSPLLALFLARQGSPQRVLEIRRRGAI